MKKYIKPNALIEDIKGEELLNQNSITNVNGLSGVEKKEGPFSGGEADSRAWDWDDDDDF